MLVNEQEQCSSSPGWTDDNTELDLVLSTLNSMLGDLPAAQQPLDSGWEMPLGDVPPAYTLEPLHLMSGVINPFQCATTTVPLYGGVQPGTQWQEFHGGAPFLVHQPFELMTHFQDQNENDPVMADVMNSLSSFFDNILTKPCPEPSPPQASTSKQKRAQNSGAYIKRPPNAFMVFMRENRERLTRTLKPKHSVEANTILGQMWRTMSPAEQEIYYQKALQERRNHTEQHPEWSSKDNYGKKIKRQRRRKGIII